jgi:hypothetical protein
MQFSGDEALRAISRQLENFSRVHELAEAGSYQNAPQ